MYTNTNIQIIRSTNSHGQLIIKVELTYMNLVLGINIYNDYLSQQKKYPPPYYCLGTFIHPLWCNSLILAYVIADFQ